MRRDSKAVEECTFSISPADTADVAALVRLEARAQLNPWSFATFALELSRVDAVFLVARAPSVQDEGVLGYVCGWLIGPEAQLHNVAVDPDYQRTGIAKQLLGAFLSQARQFGCTDCVLEARASNVAAINLYASFNFKVIGHRPQYYSNPLEDACIMSCALNKESG